MSDLYAIFIYLKELAVAVGHINERLSVRIQSAETTVSSNVAAGVKIIVSYF